MIEVEQINGWTDDAVKAMQANPPYFIWWDRWKTRGLVVALGLLGWFVLKRDD